MTISFSTVFPLRSTLPMQDVHYGRDLINLILGKSVELFGPPRSGIKFAGIKTGGARPRLLVTEDLHNAKIELSDCAERSWDSFVSELSHECVHLLNPIRGNASYLEEGMAETYSRYVQRELNIPPLNHSVKEYNDAVAMIRELPYEPFAFAKEVRSKLGALTGFSAEDLMGHFPEIDVDLAARLTAVCRTVA